MLILLLDYWRLNSAGGSRNFVTGGGRGAKYDALAASLFNANAQNELYTFCTGKGDVRKIAKANSGGSWAPPRPSFESATA